MTATFKLEEHKILTAHLKNNGLDQQLAKEKARIILNSKTKLQLLAPDLFGELSEYFKTSISPHGLCNKLILTIVKDDARSFDTLLNDKATPKRKKIY